MNKVFAELIEWMAELPDIHLKMYKAHRGIAHDEVFDAMKGFSSQQCAVLVATRAAAYGLNLTNLSQKLTLASHGL